MAAVIQKPFRVEDLLSLIERTARGGEHAGPPRTRAPGAAAERDRRCARASWWWPR